MTPSEYLKSRGWRHIGSQGSIKYWDHSSHQPDRRGAFTTGGAYKHQKEVEKVGHCDCIKPECCHYGH